MRRRNLALSGLAIALLAGPVFWPILVVRHTSMWPALRDGEDRVLAFCDGRAPARFALGIWRDPKGLLTVKRAIAFAGERVDLRGGDLWIEGQSGFERLLRPPAIRDAMAVPVFPGRGGFFTDAGIEIPEEALLDRLAPPHRGALTAHLVVQGDRNVRDEHLAPGGVMRRGDHAVADLDILVRIEALDREAQFRLDHRLGAPSADVAWSLGPLGLSFESGSTTGGSRARWPQFRPPLAIRLRTVDGELELSAAVPGAAWVRLHGEPRDTLSHGQSSTVSFSLRGGSAVLRELAVSRDVHYFWVPRSLFARHGPYAVSDGTFVLGDNPPVSEDSRALGPFPEARRFGRAIALVWPWKRIRFLP